VAGVIIAPAGDETPKTLTNIQSTVNAPSARPAVVKAVVKTFIGQTAESSGRDSVKPTH